MLNVTFSFLPISGLKKYRVSFPDLKSFSSVGYIQTCFLNKLPLFSLNLLFIKHKILPKKSLSNGSSKLSSIFGLYYVKQCAIFKFTQILHIQSFGRAIIQVLVGVLEIREMDVVVEG